MSVAISTPRSRKMTLILLAICGVLVVAAGFTGINDNPPGILLAYLAATACVLAFAHPWRTARKFLFLLLASVLGLILFASLNILIDSIVQNPVTPAALQDWLRSSSFSALNLIVAMLCPAAFLVGAVGALVMFIRNRRRTA